MPTSEQFRTLHKKRKNSRDFCGLRISQPTSQPDFLKSVTSRFLRVRKGHNYPSGDHRKLVLFIRYRCKGLQFHSNSSTIESALICSAVL
jgi:hypothetical protein